MGCKLHAQGAENLFDQGVLRFKETLSYGHQTRYMSTHTETDRQTHKHQPPNFFSPTHRRKSSFIRTCYANALAPFILYDFGLEAGIAKHCLGPNRRYTILAIPALDFVSRHRCTTSLHVRSCTMHRTTLCHSLSTYTRGA